MISAIYNKIPSVNAENVKSWALSAKDFALNNRVSTAVAKAFGFLSATFLSVLAFGSNQIKTGAVSLWTLPPAGKVGVGLIVAAALYAAKNCPVKCCNKINRANSSETELPSVNATLSAKTQSATIKPGNPAQVTEEQKAE
jgi:hypothetical protein